MMQVETFQRLRMLRIFAKNVLFKEEVVKKEIIIAGLVIHRLSIGIFQGEPVP